MAHNYIDACLSAEHDREVRRYTRWAVADKPAGENTHRKCGCGSGGREHDTTATGADDEQGI
jgi:hypothetical protein